MGRYKQLCWRCQRVVDQVSQGLDKHLCSYCIAEENNTSRSYPALSDDEANYATGDFQVTVQQESESQV